MQLWLGKWRQMHMLKGVEITILCTFWRASGDVNRLCSRCVVQVELGEFGHGPHTSTNKEISDSKNVDMKHEIGCFQTCWRVLAIDRHDQIWSGRWFWWFQSDMGNLPGISLRFSDQNSYKVSWAHPRWHSPEMVVFTGWVYWVSLSVSRSFKIDWDASLDLSWFDLFSYRKCSKHMANAWQSDQMLKATWYGW